MWLRLIHFFYSPQPGWIPLPQFPEQVIPLILKLPAPTRDLPVKFLPIDLFLVELIPTPNSFLVDRPQIGGNGTKRIWRCFEPAKLRVILMALCRSLQDSLREQSFSPHS